MSRFRFNDAEYQSAFRDLFEDSRAEETQWYRLWTGDSAGETGEFLDTSLFNEFGNGWIEKDDLALLDIDYTQFNDTDLWVKPWNDGTGEWEHAIVDFSVETLKDVTTKIDQDVSMDEMFVDDDARENLWYQLWIGEHESSSGRFVDTSFLNEYGNGWVKKENLSKLTFSLEDAGNELWVKTWSSETGFGKWNHWEVKSSSSDLPHEQVEFNTLSDPEWINDSEISIFPYDAVGYIETDKDPTDNVLHTGTGFLISPEHVMTAAHVFMDENGFVGTGADVRFYPGLSGTREEEINQGQVYEKAELYCQKSFDTDTLYPGWPDDDMAIVKLDRPVPDLVNWFQGRQSEVDELKSLEIVSSGYPLTSIEQDDPDTFGSDRFQWKFEGSITGYAENSGVIELSDQISFSGGASGSPVFYEFNNTAFFTGIYSGSSGGVPVAASLDQNSVDWMMGILQADGYDMDVV